MRVILAILLVADAVQFALGLLALVRSRRSARAGAPSFARYSSLHGLLLLGGAVLFAVPAVLGLTGPLPARTAVYVAFGLELVAFVPARIVVKRLEAAHMARRPAAAAS